MSKCPQVVTVSVTQALRGDGSTTLWTCWSLWCWWAEWLRTCTCGTDAQRCHRPCRISIRRVVSRATICRWTREKEAARVPPTACKTCTVWHTYSCSYFFCKSIRYALQKQIWKHVCLGCMIHMLSFYIIPTVYIKTIVTIVALTPLLVSHPCAPLIGHLLTASRASQHCSPSLVISSQHRDSML